MKFSDILEFRHACKSFDESKKISQEDLDFILNAGRLAPSSFGIEHWEFEVIRNENLKQEIKKVCWDQEQVGNCAELVIIYAKIFDVKPNSQYIESQFARRADKNPEQVKARISKFAGMLEDKFTNNYESFFSWSRTNCFLAAENMMLAAASLGIDSCAIEGFKKSDLEKILDIDTGRINVALVLPFGYRKNPAPKKLRRDLNEIVRYRY